MNWLAHLFLSEPDPAFRVGNLLPDLLPISVLSDLAPEILRGVRQHRRIDAFTDTHPVVRRSINRLNPPLRRFGGIVVDVFYDHFLSRDWERYSKVPLSNFIGEIYVAFESCRARIPAEACERLEQMRRGNWLRSYGELSGISSVLSRIGQRLREPVPLADAVPMLQDHYDLLHGDFATFFPELVSHVSER
jgi:acyl carrier protein phosphodiesterase